MTFPRVVVVAGLLACAPAHAAFIFIDSTTGQESSYTATGTDGAFVTGTAGTNGNCAEWNIDGDLVDAGAACGTGGGASQLSDLSDVGVTTPTDRNLLVADGDSWESRALTEADISDLGTYLTAEVNDLTAAVTWANIPDANVPSTAITQHETALEGVLDLADLQGAVTDAQVPDNITISLAATATALAANGSNCAAGSYPLGVDAAGAVEGCTDATTEIDSAISTHAGAADPHTVYLLESAVDSDITTLTIGASASISGSNTGDQTIELTGDVTGSGTGTFAATIASEAVTPAKVKAGATDEYCLTYELTGSTWEWQACSGAEVNDLTAAVTWANIPDANVPDDITLALESASLTALADDEVLVGSGAASGAFVTLPDCADEAEVLGYDQATNSFVCTADAGAGGGMTSWTLSGDTGTPEAVTDGNTVDISGDTSGIDTAVSATDTVTISYDATEAETANEGVLDLQDLQGAVTDAQVPDDVTITLAATATALAANGDNCAAGSYPLGVDASGAAEGCTDATTEIDSAITTHAAIADAHHDPVTLAASVTNVLALTTQVISGVDAGAADALVGWDDTAGALDYLSAADAIAALGIDADIATLTIGASASVSGTNTGDQDLADTVAEITDLDNDAATLTIAPSSSISGTNTGDQDLADTVAEITDLDNDAATLTIAASSSISGSNTGDQTITLTGDVTGSGTGSFAASIADDAVTPDDVLSTGQTDEYCLTYEATGTTWEWQACASGSGDVTGPASSTDNAIARFDGAGGKTIQDSPITISDITSDVITITTADVTDQFKFALEPGISDTGVLISPAGFTSPTGQGSYQLYIKAEDTDTYNHAIGIESGTVGAGELLHMYNASQAHVVKFNIDSNTDVNILVYDSDGTTITHDLGGDATNGYLVVNGQSSDRTGSEEFNVQGNAVVSGSLTVGGSAVLTAETNNLETNGAAGIGLHELVVGANPGVAQYTKISALTEETTPTTGDWLLCEESGGAIRKCDVGDLPAGSEANNLETVTTGIATGEIPIGTSADTATYSKTSALTEETAPASGDWLLGEESGGNVRKFDVGDLPYRSGPDIIWLAASDESTALTTGTAKWSAEMPQAFTIDTTIDSGIGCSVVTAPTTTGITVDINEAGATILNSNSKINIDATENNSQDAITAPLVTDASLAKGAIITVDIDAVGSGTAGAGLKCWLIGEWQ